MDDIKMRLYVKWLRLKEWPVFGGAFYHDSKLVALMFNTSGINQEFKIFATKTPVLPDVSGMGIDERTKALQDFFKDREEWVDYLNHVASFSKELRERLSLEKMIVSPDNGADILVQTCGIEAVMAACVPWVLEKDLVAAPPSNAVAAKSMTKEPPASIPPKLLQLPAIGVGSKPPVHPDSSAHLAGIAGAVAEVADATRDLFDGTEPVAPDEIVEVSEDDKHA